MKAKVLLGILALLLLAGISPAHADDWQRLREAADKMFGGWDVTVSLTTGVSTKTYLEGSSQTQSGPYGKLEMKVPLYSKQERIAQQGAKQAFLQKGAELIRTMEEGKRKIAVLKRSLRAQGLCSDQRYRSDQQVLRHPGRDREGTRKRRRGKEEV